jgi:hypothetical protein
VLDIEEAVGRISTFLSGYRNRAAA